MTILIGLRSKLDLEKEDVPRNLKVICILEDENEEKCLLSGMVDRREFAVYSDSFKELFKFIIEEVFKKTYRSIFRVILENLDKVDIYDLADLLRRWFRVKVEFWDMKYFVEKCREVAENRLFNILRDLVVRHGKAIILASGSTNLYDDWRNTKDLELPWDREYTLAEKYEKTCNGDIEEKILLLLKDGKIIGIALYHRSGGISGTDTYVNEYYNVIPFRTLEVRVKYVERRSVPGEVGYLQLWGEGEEKIIIYRTSREVALMIYNILKQFNESLRIEEELKQYVGSEVKLESILEGYTA